MTALAAAHADTADRVLLMPYTKWQDYRVLFIFIALRQPSEEDPTGPSEFDKASAISLLTLEHFQKFGKLENMKYGEKLAGD